MAVIFCFDTSSEDKLCPGSTKVKPNNNIIILFVQSDKL